jgi:hypothetical protein
MPQLNLFDEYAHNPRSSLQAKSVSFKQVNLFAKWPYL